MSPLAVGSARHFPWSESEGPSGVGTGKGLGAGARGGGMSVAAADERLRWPWGNGPSGAPKASGQTHLAGPHAWLRATHPGFATAAATREREVGKMDTGACSPPKPGSGQLLPQQSPHNQTGQAWGRGVAASTASIQAPTIIYSILSPPRHVVPSQTEMGRRHHRDKTEGGFNYSVFQSPQTYSGAKRTIYLVNKRNRRGKLVFALILMFMGESLTGTPHMGTVVSLHQASVNEHRFSNPGQNAG